MMAARKKARAVRITLMKSPIGSPERQRRTLLALGLRRREQTVEQMDSPALRGMLDKVKHLVEVEES